MRRGPTLSVLSWIWQRKPSRKHRCKHAIAENKLMIERCSCMEPGNPEDRIAEPGVDICDRRAQVMCEWQARRNLDSRKQRDGMPFEPRTRNGCEWNCEEEDVKRPMRHLCQDRHPRRRAGVRSRI